MIFNGGMSVKKIWCTEVVAENMRGLNMEVERERGPVTLDDLVRELKEIGIKEGQTISVHTSMRKIGWVVGGAETLIRALLYSVGATGTVMMPSQTWKNLDPSTGVHWEQPEEWWPIIRENWPAYDPEVTPAIGMGVVAEMFRKWPGVKRSNHPARSFAAVGKNAEYLVGDHDLENIFGRDSPLDKLYKLDGYVLLIGVGHNKNTSLHLAETRAKYPGKHCIGESSAMIVEGKRRWVNYKTLAVEDEDFIELGEAYNREKGIHIQKLNNAETLFIRQKPLVDWAVRWMEENRKVK